MGLSRKKKSGKKGEVGESAKRVHKKVPGFDAFCKTKVPQVKRRKGKKLKMVECEDIAEPETGIHSLEWAKAIAPQESGFLKLPYEVRLKIYEHAVEDFTFAKVDTPIEPRKKGKRFWSPGWDYPATDTERLYMICRQSYVDVVGSGLIYRLKSFTFPSPAMMLNYLLVIHPVHRDAIRSIAFTAKLSRTSQQKIAPLALETLASMPNLQSLTLKLMFSSKVHVGNSHHGYPIRRYSVQEEVLNRLKNNEGLVGKKDEDGNVTGGIRGLTSLKVDIYAPCDYYGWEPSQSDYGEVLSGWFWSMDYEVWQDAPALVGHSPDWFMNFGNES
ncbi:uncharacterized protein PAC_00849 [Phialocephala subalpina]|uniref:Uncharacterized protein n=1 Tax=Phialocephala subalpina TaxID=576137 RepID=A0A1L7WDW2_9HELO|nr:uncharacterized protein PAC_00849 [Phialocephala subalpina]